MIFSPCCQEMDMHHGSHKIDICMQEWIGGEFHGKLVGSCHAAGWRQRLGLLCSAAASPLAGQLCNDVWGITSEAHPSLPTVLWGFTHPLVNPMELKLGRTDYSVACNQETWILFKISYLMLSSPPKFSLSFTHVDPWKTFVDDNNNKHWQNII